MTRIARTLRAEDGFTVVELLTAASLMILILGATITTFSSMLQGSRESDAQNEAQDVARTAIDRLARELRGAGTPGSELPLGIERATANDLVAVTVAETRSSPTANPRAVQRVRFCLDTTRRVIWRQVQPLTATPLPAMPATTACDGTGWPSSNRLVSGVANDASNPVFTLGPSGWATADAITSVGVLAIVDADPARKPLPTRLNTTVRLRNQNAAPVAGITALALGAGDVQLVAAGSRDPEGRPLTYRWTGPAGALTACNDQDSCSLTGQPTGSRTYSLTVRDPAGIAATATTTVTVT